jgi:hypothetical protein
VVVPVVDALGLPPISFAPHRKSYDVIFASSPTSSRKEKFFSFPFAKREKKKEERAGPLTTTTMSTSLVWQIVKHNHSGLRRRGRNVFSREPGNLSCRNTLQCSGYANTRTVDILPPGEDGRATVVLAHPYKKRVAAHVVRIKLGKSGFARNARAVRGILKQYRPDLVRVAMHRMAKYNVAHKHAVAAARKQKAKAALEAKKAAEKTDK